MSLISITYDLGRHGWSRLKLTLGGKTLDIGPFGYCTDALGDLIRAALMLATSAYHVEVCFDGEPYEWRLIVDEGWKPELRLRVEGNGVVLIEGCVTADEFARTIQKVGQDIWDGYKAEGYNEAWNGPRGFPLRALKGFGGRLILRRTATSETLGSVISSPGFAVCRKARSEASWERGLRRSSAFARSPTPRPNTPRNSWSRSPR